MKSNDFYIYNLELNNRNKRVRFENKNNLIILSVFRSYYQKNYYDFYKILCS